MAKKIVPVDATVAAIAAGEDYFTENTPALTIAPAAATAAQITAGGAAVTAQGGTDAQKAEDAYNAMIVVDDVAEATVAEAVWDAMIAAIASADTDIMDKLIAVTRTNTGVVTASPAEYTQYLLNLRKAILGVTLPGAG